jgi:Tol biopolymer transport system component/DNA-binding winged helix-turn-helix (wHTH) protein
MVLFRMGWGDDMPGPRSIRFGVFELDLHTRELRKHGIRLKLQDQPLKVLHALLEHPGELVTREELQHRLWSDDTFVDFDQSLNRAVNRVREVLGDGADVPRFIETLPRRGYRFIAPVQDALKQTEASAPEPSPSARSEGQRQWRWSVSNVWAAAISISIVVVAAILLFVRQATFAVPVVRFTIGPPDKTSFVRSDGVIGSMAISPDGRRIVFSARSAGGSQLWVRYLDQLIAQPLAGTENALFPFWSPDSRSIGFTAGGRLKKFDLAAGQVVTLADMPGLRGGTWNREDSILFAPSRAEPLRRVPSAGGNPSTLMNLDTANARADHLWPCFLPDGRHFLFSTMEASNRAHYTIRAGSLDSPETKVIREADSNAVFAAGTLLFQWESALMAQPFDPKRLTATGAPVPISENLGSLVTGKGSFAVSDNGVLVYAARQQTQFMWFDRAGRQVSAVGEPGSLGRIHLSPNGERATVAVTAGSNTNIWIYNVVSGIRTRLTFGPSTDMIGVWSPDGRTIVFDSNRKGHQDLYRNAADGTGSEELLYADSLEKGPSSWSPDGKILLYNALSRESAWDIWALPLERNQLGVAQKPYPFLKTAANEQQAQFSPDGRWVLYQSDESGAGEIYVTRFPVPGGKRRISPAGGGQPRWRRDGREIFYISSDGKLMAAHVRTNGSTLEIGETRPLFMSPLVAGQGFAFDVSPDGQRFLMKTSLVGSASTVNDYLTVVQNWAAGLTK